MYVFQKGVIKYRHAPRTKIKRLILQNAWYYYLFKKKNKKWGSNINAQFEKTVVSN